MIKITRNSRMFACGDVHGEIDIRKLNTMFWPEQKDLTENDILIQVGDFGIIWDAVSSKREKFWLKWFDAKPFYTLFISGNHDNHWRLSKYPVIDFYGGKASKISEKVYHLKNGYVYDFGGKKFWMFGGADSIDKEYRKEGVTWWREEIPDMKTMEFGLQNLEDVGYTVDYIITHTMPKEIIKILKQDKMDDPYRLKYKDPVSGYLDEVLRRMLHGYTHWYCGHMHEDKTMKHWNLSILYNGIVEIGNEENYALG